MKKLILLITILFLGQISVFAKDVKFIQVTDVHFNRNNSKPLIQFVEDINNDFKDVDFVVFTGDNLDKANPKDLYAFAEIVKKIKPKVYVTLGNHDLYKSQQMTHINYMHLIRKKLGLYHSNKPNYVIKRGNFVFLTMNGVKEVIPGPNGYYKFEELQWLDKQLTKYKDKKVVILQHFPLLETKTKNHNLYRKEDYLEILKKHNNVISIVSGHYHENREEMINGIYHIITKNFQNNTYYKIIEIQEGDNFVFTSLIDNSSSD